MTVVRKKVVKTRRRKIAQYMHRMIVERFHFRLLDGDDGDGDEDPDADSGFFLFR